MSYHFDVDKAVQCVAYLLKRSPGGQRDYGSVIKLLYLADRESLAETGSPITGDAPFAMPHGPVLSTLLDLARHRCGDEEFQAVWDKYIETRHLQIRLILDPGEAELSEYEAALLDRVYARDGAKTFWQLEEETHRLPEWLEAYREETSTPIALHRLLAAVGRSDYDALSTKKIEDAHFAKLFR